VIWLLGRDRGAVYSLDWRQAALWTPGFLECVVHDHTWRCVKGAEGLESQRGYLHWYKCLWMRWPHQAYLVLWMSACAPAVNHAVRQTLEAHPYLLNDEISLEQATKLFFGTIRVASAATPMKPVAVVIDALDETNLKVTAEIFSRVLVDLPPNAKVFTSSCVETVIRDNFADHPCVMNIHLSAKNSVIDVTKFLETKVCEIMAEYHIDWFEWGHRFSEFSHTTPSSHLLFPSPRLFVGRPAFLLHLCADLESHWNQHQGVQCV